MLGGGKVESRLLSSQRQTTVLNFLMLSLTTAQDVHILMMGILFSEVFLVEYLRTAEITSSFARI